MITGVGRKRRPSQPYNLTELNPRLGPMPAWRIRTNPPPGLATTADVVRIQREEHRFCELSDGILVEKDLASDESVIAGRLLTMRNTVVIPPRLGLVTGEAGKIKINPQTVRIPDVAFVSVQRLPSGEMPREALSLLVPNLLGEVLSRGGPVEDMQHRLQDDFEAGVDLVRLVEPRQRTVEVLTAPGISTFLKETQFLM